MGIIDTIKKRKTADSGRKWSEPAKPTVGAEGKKAATGKKAENKTAERPVRGPLAKEGGGQAALVIVSPVLTEKASRQEALGKYSFYVAVGATKVAVAEAIRDLYGVKPVSVRISRVHGKSVRVGRVRGRQKDRRKAIVTLKRGDAISLY
ncbi:50S ribosomal protein L23 [Candidatus Uhrbacteria bacterium]|nr:50S ribosomal protein L23 [Candidatus Uhrbacteria bacterium]